MSRGAFFPLFVPATRPDRIARACASGAGAVIVDLEDAVAPGDKEAARDGLADAVLTDKVPVFVRINAHGTRWFDPDVAAVARLPVAGIVLPKAEHGNVADDLRQQLAPGAQLLALIETARGLADVRRIAGAFDRLLFGSLDYAADLGVDPVPKALAHAQGELVLTARLAGQPGPCDGVTPDINDPARVEADARHGARLGFRGKMLIHPSQLAPARAAYRPAPDQVDWARRVLEAGVSDVARLDGEMVDLPVIARARRILEDAEGDATHG